MPNVIVVNTAVRGEAATLREYVLDELHRLFPKKPKQLTAEQRQWLVGLAKHGWDDFEIDLALDEHGLPYSVDRLRGFFGLRTADAGALHVKIGTQYASIDDHWQRVIAGRLPVASFSRAVSAAHGVRMCVAGTIAAVGQVDKKLYTASVDAAVALCARLDPKGTVVASVAAKLGDDADFLQAKALVFALDRAGKLTARHDKLISNALSGIELAPALRALLQRLTAKRRERILLGANAAGYPIGKPKPHGAWLYYDLEPSPAIARHVRRLIAKTPKRELPATRARELQALLAT